MRKFLSALILVSAVSTTAYSYENVRTFEVNWNSPDGSDSDVQMCDDNYYTKAEILFPDGPRIDPVAIRDYIASECTSMDISIDHVGSSPKGFVRYTLEGLWGCELTFQEPGKNAKGKYTIYLGDGC